MNQNQNKVVQTFCTKLSALLDARIQLQDAIRQLVPVYNKASRDDQLEIRSKVAQLISKKQGGVKPIMITKGVYKGSLGFSKVGKAQNNAREMLRTMFPTSSTTSSTTSKKVDVVEQKSKAIKSWGMTKAQVLKAVEIAFAKK